MIKHQKYGCVVYSIEFEGIPEIDLLLYHSSEMPDMILAPLFYIIKGPIFVYHVSNGCTYEIDYYYTHVQ